MNATKAAAALLELLHAPKGAVTVLPRREGDGFLLEVLFDERALAYSERVPSNFNGFRTLIKKRNAFKTLLH